MIAEVKMKVDNYNLSEDEKAAMTAFLDNQRKGGYEEMNIRDVVKNISTKGFSAVWQQQIDGKKMKGMLGRVFPSKRFEKAKNQRIDMKIFEEFIHILISKKIHLQFY